VKFYPSSPRTSPATIISKPSYDEVGWYVDPCLPEEAGHAPNTSVFKYHSYPNFKNTILERRGKEGPARVPELEILYRFYSHFLRRHFNLGMYNEFKSLALEDFHKESEVGIEYLYKLHVYKIHDFPTPDLIFQDFASLASQQNEKPPYDKDKVDAVTNSKQMSTSTKNRLSKFMQEKSKNFHSANGGSTHG
jgi:hypothetical protein